ncbi:MAG: hypothetical protein QOI35_203 [Cryptosporangiaceae bacterium]|nr:hypothetical protein [Cryptosporangiaceae bacterium]
MRSQGRHGISWRRLSVMLAAAIVATIGTAVVAAPAQAATRGPIIASNGACVTIADGSSASSTAVVTAPCTGADSQRWSVYADGTIRALGMCLSKNGGGRGYEFGVPVLIWSCNDPDRGRWTAKPTAFGGMRLEPFFNVCLVAGGTGQAMIARACFGIPNESFTMPTTPIAELPPPPPSLPPSLDAVQANGGVATLGWTDRSTNEASFQVYRRVGNGPLQAASDPIATRSMFDQGGTYTSTDAITPGARVCYEIVNRSSANVAGYSNEACTKPPALPTPPAAGIAAISAPAVPEANGYTGGSPAATTGADGLGIVSYTAQRATDNGWKLTVGHCRNVACTAVDAHTIDADGSNGDYSAIKIGSDGLPIISYTAALGTNPANALRVAHCADSACTSATITTLDTTAYVDDTAVTIGADGLASIAYQDDPLNGVSTAIKIAHCANLACTSATTRTVDTVNDNNGSTGAWLSIATSPAGGPVLAYVDAAAKDLKVTACTDPTCATATTSTVDAGLVGDSPSITIGLDGLPVISYGGWPPESNLKVAHCRNLLCTSATTTIADNRTDTGLYSTIALGGDGLPVISYYDLANADVDIAHCADITCATITHKSLDTEGDQGNGGDSVTIGADGLPLIAYYDATFGQLKTAHCADPACSTPPTVRSTTKPAAKASTRAAANLARTIIVRQHQ